MKPSPNTITSLLTSLFPSGMFDYLAREREVVIRERKLDIRVLVWTMVVGFAVGGEARSIAAYRQAYNGATGQNLVTSRFYDRFTEQLEQLLRDLLNHEVKEVAVLHTIAPAFNRFRNVVVADATVVQLIRFLSAFHATHLGASGLKIYLVHSVTTQSVIARTITDKRTLFETGSWLRGRLFLLDLDFLSTVGSR